MVAVAETAGNFPEHEGQQICRIMKQIRKTWTPEQREYRAKLARRKLNYLIPYLSQ